MTSAYLDRFPGDVTSLRLPDDYSDATIHVASTTAAEASPEMAVFQDDSPEFTLFDEAVAASMHTVAAHVESLDAPDPQGEAQHTRTQELRSAIDAFRQKIDDQESLVKTCEAKLASTRTLLPPIWTRLSTLQTTGRDLTKEYQTLKKQITPLVDELNHPEKLPTLSDIPCLCVIHGGYTDPETGAVVSSAEHLDELEKNLKESQEEHQALAQAHAEIQFQSDAEQKIFRGATSSEHIMRLEEARAVRNRSERRLETAEESMLGLQRTLLMIREAAQKRLDAQLGEIADQRAAKEAELADLKQSASETLAKLETAQVEYSEAVKDLGHVEIQIGRHESELTAASAQLDTLLKGFGDSQKKHPDTEPDSESVPAEQPEPAGAKTQRRLRAVPDTETTKTDPSTKQPERNPYAGRVVMSYHSGSFHEGLDE